MGPHDDETSARRAITDGLVARVLAPGEGTPLEMGVNQDVMEMKVGGDDTHGHVTFIEYHAFPESSGVRPHWHEGHEECFYVLEGTMRFRIEDEIVDAGPGTFAYVPRGVIHAFWNPGDVPCRFVGTFSPAGFESIFVDRVRLLEETGGDVTPEQLNELALQHGVRYVDPLPGHDH